MFEYVFTFAYECMSREFDARRQASLLPSSPT